MFYSQIEIDHSPLKIEMLAPVVFPHKGKLKTNLEEKCASIIRTLRLFPQA